MFRTMTMMLFVSVTLTAWSQDEDYVLTLSDAEGGAQVDSTVLFTNDGDNVEAWSFDVCHDEDQVAIFASDITSGDGIADLDFLSHNIEIHEAGFSVSAVLDSDTNTIGIETDLEMYTMTYIVLLDIDDTTISFCGDYVAANVVADGVDIEPTTNEGILESDGGQLLYVPDESVLLDDDEVTVPLNLVSTAASITGWSGGVCHDDLLDIATNDIDFGADTEDRAYLFDSVSVYGGGWTFGAILSAFGGGTLSSGDTYELYVMTYEIEDFGDSTLEICDTLGTPAVALQLVAPGGSTVEFDTRDAAIEILEEESAIEFLRGDIDGNGEVSTLVDALRLLNHAFGDADAPPCDDAADVDGNNAVSALIDSIYLLRWTFADGEDPADPGPDVCGEDDDADEDVLCETASAGCA